LDGADLSGANLSFADLSGADLIGTNLMGANLNGTDLSYVDLSGAKFMGVNFGPNGPDPRNFVGCVGWEDAVFDEGVKEELMAGLEALEAEGEHNDKNC